MFCRKCGEDIGNANFCPKCGTPSQDAPKDAQEAQPPAPVENSGGRQVVILWILTVFSLSTALAYFPSVTCIFAVLFAVLAVPLDAVQGILKKVRISGKLRVALLVALFLAMLLTAPVEPKEKTPGDPAENTPGNPVVDTTPDDAGTQDADDEPEALTPEEAKDLAERVDGVYSVAAKYAERYYGILVDDMSGLETEESSLLDVYGTCEDIKEYMKNYSDQLDTVEDPAAGEYKDAVYYYIWNIYAIADDLIKYIDDEKMEDLESAEEGMSLIGYYTNEIASARINYLQGVGFTEEEIDSLLAEGTE